MGLSTRQGSGGNAQKFELPNRWMNTWIDEP